MLGRSYSLVLPGNLQRFSRGSSSSTISKHISIAGWNSRTTGCDLGLAKTRSYLCLAQRRQAGGVSLPSGVQLAKKQARSLGILLQWPHSISPCLSWTLSCRLFTTEQGLRRSRQVPVQTLRLKISTTNAFSFTTTSGNAENGLSLLPSLELLQDPTSFRGIQMTRETSLNWRSGPPPNLTPRVTNSCGFQHQRQCVAFLH